MSEMDDVAPDEDLSARFDDPKSAQVEKNGELAASLINNLVGSDSWGEIPVAPAFTALFSAIPVRHGSPTVDVIPNSPREVIIDFRLTTDHDPGPSLHSLARAFGLSSPRVRIRETIITGAGPRPSWELQGLPRHVQCEAQQSGPRELTRVSKIFVRRPGIPERENERATKRLVDVIKAAHRGADARDGQALPELTSLSTLFPVDYSTVHTGFRWINLDRLWSGLGSEAGTPQGHTLSVRGPGGLPMRTAPSLELELPLSRNRRLAVEARLSTGRWVRKLSIGCYFNPS
jgi:hypothetical protein